MQPQNQGYWQPEASSPNEETHLDIAATAISGTQSSIPVAATDKSIGWQASEYIHHQKDMMWFIGLGACGLVLVAISLFLIKSLTFTILLVVMIVAVVVLANRPPRTLRYQLGAGGLQIDDKTYRYDEFRAFGVVEDGPLYSISLIPVKRFMPAVNLYFPQEEAEKIVDRLGSAIPMEAIKPDIIDKISRKLRF